MAEGPAADAQAAGGDAVAAILGLLQQGARRYRFKPPTYDGSTDVELYTQQFADVQAANEWNAAEAVLHLRSCLEDDAIDSGTGATVEAIFANLRARFGLTQRQARDRLSVLQRKPSQSLQALGLECERLVNVAYPNLGNNMQNTLAIDAFNRALDDRNLKRHLLLAGAETLTDTVRHAEEYLQVGNKDRRNDNKQTRLAAADLTAVAATRQKPTSQDGPTDTSTQLDGLLQRLDRLTALLEGQTNNQSYRRTNGGRGGQRGRGSNRPNQSSGQQRPREGEKCYECDGIGHYARDCPTRKNRATRPSETGSGNDQGPRQ